MPVESDVYDICSRIEEISPDLYILVADPPMDGFTYIVMERMRNGSDGLVTRTNALDQRLVDHLRYILKVPISERLALLEKQEYIAEADRKEAEFEELYERLGRPMWSQLEHDGFIQRNISYPKRGVKADSVHSQ
jgi:hypothetical protein